jgi:hypothetical protein
MGKVGSGVAGPQAVQYIAAEGAGVEEKTTRALSTTIMTDVEGDANDSVAIAS